MCIVVVIVRVENKLDTHTRFGVVTRFFKKWRVIS
jgi:hypothetical protein